MGQLTLAMPAHNSRGDVFLVIIMELDASRLLTQWQEPMVSKNRAIQVYATDTLGQYLLHPRPGLSRLSVPSPAQAHTFTQDFSARPGFFESFGVSGFDALRAYQGPEGVILFAAPLEIAIGNSVEKDVTRVWTGLPLAKFEQQLDQLVFVETPVSASTRYAGTADTACRAALPPEPNNPRWAFSGRNCRPNPSMAWW